MGEIEIPADQMSWLNRFVTPLTKLFQERHAEVQVELRNGFYRFNMRTVERCGLVKTIMSHGARVELENFYVSPIVKIGKSNLNHEQFARRVDNRKRIILTGTAALGKSLFLKYLSLLYCKSSSKPLPLFFELRDLNETKINLEEALYNTACLPAQFLSKAQFEYALKEGMIAILLDAFDEIDFDLKERYEREIHQLTLRYPDAQVIVTSRPTADEKVEGWSSFEHGALQPFDKARVIELIRKTDEEEAAKDKFIELVDTKLFESHESFLSTPLLALIMFLTFQTGSRIPDRLHEFYHRAFEALYYRHDTQKGHFTRKPYTSLNRDDFLRLISALCAITYFEGQTIFSEDELRKRVNTAKEFESINVETQGFVNDLIESVCMLQRDGSEIAFTHRSFQEYFTAIYILNSETLDTFAVINQLIGRQNYDNVVSIMFEINREFVEKRWVLKWLGQYADKVANIDCNTMLVQYMKHLRYGIMLFFSTDGYRAGMTGSGEDSSAISTILTRLYLNDYHRYIEYHRISTKKIDDEFKKIASYFMARDSIKIPKKKAERPAIINVKVTEKDNAIFANTHFSAALSQQKSFLLKLKDDIDLHHRQKGDGFMSLIRR